MTELVAEVVAEIAPKRRRIQPDVGKAIDVWSKPDRVIISGPEEFTAWVAILPEEAHALSACIVKGKGEITIESPGTRSEVSLTVTRRRVVLTVPGRYGNVVADFRPETAVQLNNALVEHAIAAGWRESEPEPPQGLAAPREVVPPTWSQRLAAWVKL